MNHWLTGLFEGLPILIILIEALFSMGPLVANQMWALIVNFATFTAFSDVMYIPSDFFVVQHDRRTD